MVIGPTTPQYKPELVKAMLANDREAALTLAAECSGHDCYSGSKHAIARWVLGSASVCTPRHFAERHRTGLYRDAYDSGGGTERRVWQAIKQFGPLFRWQAGHAPRYCFADWLFALPEAHFIAGSLVYADGDMTPYSAQTSGHNAPLPTRPPYSRYRRESCPFTFQARLLTH